MLSNTQTILQYFLKYFSIHSNLWYEIFQHPVHNFNEFLMNLGVLEIIFFWIFELYTIFINKRVNLVLPDRRYQILQNMIINPFIFLIQHFPVLTLTLIDLFLLYLLFYFTSLLIILLLIFLFLLLPKQLTKHYSIIFYFPDLKAKINKLIQIHNKPINHQHLNQNQNKHHY